MRSKEQDSKLYHNKHFTPKQKAEAVQLVREGQSAAEVARKLNTNRKNVERWVRAEEQRTGQQIVQPHFTPKQKAEAIRLARETQNFAEVARKLNINRKNVERWVRAEEQRTGQQIVTPPQHFTPEQKAEAVRLVREGQTVAEVAREFNASRQNVERWVRAEEQRTGQQIVTQRQQHFTPEEKAEAVRLVREGQSVAEVARELNTSQQNVRNWVQRINDIIEKLEEYGFSNEIQEAIKSDIPPFTMARNNIEDIIKHIEEIRETCTEALTEDNLI